MGAEESSGDRTGFGSDGCIYAGELQKREGCLDCDASELLRGVARATRNIPADDIVPGIPCVAEMTCHGKRDMRLDEAGGIPLPASVCDVRLTITVDPFAS